MRRQLAPRHVPLALGHPGFEAFALGAPGLGPRRLQRSLGAPALPRNGLLHHPVQVRLGQRGRALRACLRAWIDCLFHEKVLLPFYARRLMRRRARPRISWDIEPSARRLRVFQMVFYILGYKQPHAAPPGAPRITRSRASPCPPAAPPDPAAAYIPGYMDGFLPGGLSRRPYSAAAVTPSAPKPRTLSQRSRHDIPARPAVRTPPPP